jgi:ubiquitin carboxyl-terminal hydrolase 8
VTCVSCQNKSVKFETFRYLTLPILAERCDLYDCLKLFSESENLQQVYCSKCGENRNSCRKIEIWKLPPLLIITLNRFKYHGEWREKINTMVDYPLESLNLESFAINKPKNKYHLYATSNHSGSLAGGHYFALCRLSIPGKWFEFNDEIVREINDLSTIHSPTSYILFYSQNN